MTRLRPFGIVPPVQPRRRHRVCSPIWKMVRDHKPHPNGIPHKEVLRYSRPADLILAPETFF